MPADLPTPGTWAECFPFRCQCCSALTTISLCCYQRWLRRIMAEIYDHSTIATGCSTLCCCSIQLSITKNATAGSERSRLFVNLPSSSQAEDYLIDTRIIQAIPCSSLVSKEVRTNPSKSDEGCKVRYRYYIEVGCRGPQWCSDTHSL